MGLRCKRCGSEEHVKNGLMRGQQRYLCKECGLNFTNTPPRGKPLALKAAAVLLYVSGLSMNRTAQLLGVSTPTIQAWLEQFAQAYAQKPEPEGRAVVIELDEMWHDLKKSPNRSGSGAARLAAIPAGESPANRGVQCCCSHIQRREGRPTRRKPGCKSPRWARDTWSDPSRGASNLTGRSKCEPGKP